MELTGRLDRNSGVGVPIKLYEAKVYDTVPDVNGYFADENGKIIARRQTVYLTQDSEYRTQFFNEKLKLAITPKNKYTGIKYYCNGKQVNELQFLPTLKQDYASIVCQVEPIDPITSISVVIYTAQTEEKVFLKDGSSTMEPGYIPVKPTDVVTKEYADDMIEDFTAANFPLRNLSITQGGEKPLKAICYQNNEEYDVLRLKFYKSYAGCENCQLIVEPFCIANNFTEATSIALVHDSKTSHVASIADILEGKGSYWKLLETENVYTVDDVNPFYWRNKYALTFNLLDLFTTIDSLNPFVELRVRIADDNGNSKLSKPIRIGVDEYISKAQAQAENTYVKETLQEYKTKWTSGFAYFPHEFDTIYSLPFTFIVKNNFLQYFRPQHPFTLTILDANRNVQFTYDIEVDTHQPTSGEFQIDKDIEIKASSRFLLLKAFNIKKENVFTYEVKLDIDSDYSDESNRVTTPPASVHAPLRDYGEAWDSKKALESWEPKLYHGVYTIDDPSESALCFKVDVEDCYSHINIDIEHDGEMYIKSEGNTDWLDCQNLAKPFVIPVKEDAPCAVNEGYFTFGKVVYTSPVFIRILKASKVVFNSAAVS